MKLIIKLAVLLFISVFPSTMSFAQVPVHGAESEDLLITNVTIISPQPKKLKVFKGYVLVKNGSISFVGKKRPRIGKAARVLNGRGKFLIPGLIDSHVHLANIAGLNFKIKKVKPELATTYYEQMPKSYLYFGFTTVIDLNNHSPKVLGSILRNKIRPEIFTCGEQLEVMNGFMMAETKPQNRYKYHPNFLHDRFNKNVSIRSDIDVSRHTPKARIKDLKQNQNGVCTKIAFENGFGGTEDVMWAMPTKEIVKELAAEARKAKIPVLLHANSFESQQFALETKVDIIAHGMWHWGELISYIKVRELPDRHKQLLARIAKKQIGYQPTFRVIAGQRDVFDDKFIEDRNLEHVYPKEFLAFLKTDEGKWQQNNIKKYAKGFFDGKTNAEIKKFMQPIVDKISVSAGLVAKEKGRLLFGSDTPSSNAHTNPPGYNGFLEMREWYKAGISLEQILRAATINNAKAFHLDKHYGSIEEGKKANLLFLDKNPLKTLSAYDSIDTVILNGKAFKRSDFSAAKDQ